MWYKKVLIIAFGILFLSVFLHKTYADEIEGRFKDVSSQIAKEFTQASPAGKETTVSDKEREDIFARQARLFKEWQEELRSLIKADPQSIWAEDAQYIIATLNAGNPKQETIELECLLKEYPNVHIEDWTRETLALIIPNKPIDQVARMALCFNYKELGDIEKLKKMCKESIQKYPEKAKFFEKLEGAVLPVSK